MAGSFPVAARYGWHCLIFEGPGQWAALKTNPGLLFRPDYEKPVSAVVDYLFSRPDVDQDKVALMRLSPAARWGFQHAQWTLGMRKPHEWPDVYAPFTLKGLESHFWHSSSLDSYT